MRRIYLIRHGAPDFPPGAKLCLGRTDLPLGPLGRMQACQLAEVLKPVRFSAVFSSPLSRAAQTAAYLSDQPVLLEGLEELDTGDWDGLDFREIRARWPEHYAARGADPGLPPPNGEDVTAGQRRFLDAVRRALARSEGDIAVVAHSSVNQTLLCHAIGCSPREGRRFRLPYASYCVLSVAEDGFRAERLAQTARPPLTEELAQRLLEAAGPPERVRAHCRAVASEAARIADALPLSLDRDCLIAAALLHDAARTEPDHPRRGAEWLRALGYPNAAESVEQHHDLTESTLGVASVLYLADKCVQGTVPVSLDVRFAGSGSRCRTEEAQAAWNTRYETAKRVRDQINQLCGRNLF